MSTFIKVPADNNSLGKRKPIYGIGTNDADYITKHNGIRCPYYKVWFNMMKRCYSTSFHKVQPTYANATVDINWLSFMTFRAWMKQQNWKGMQLDKDILVPGNKVYSPTYCIFLSAELNSLLTHVKSNSNGLGIGVAYNKKTKVFKVYMRMYSKAKYLGTYATADEAAAAYKQAKQEHIINIANQQSDVRIQQALLVHANNI